jgi:hypothetical protein
MYGLILTLLELELELGLLGDSGAATPHYNTALNCTSMNEQMSK